MTEAPSYLRQMATQWRELAAVGDPARRAGRERWAAALDQMAESQTSSSQKPVLSSEAEEKKS